LQPSILSAALTENKGNQRFQVSAELTFFDRPITVCLLISFVSNARAAPYRELPTVLLYIRVLNSKMKPVVTAIGLRLKKGIGKKGSGKRAIGKRVVGKREYEKGQ
jgi:hypothetical protein